MWGTAQDRWALKHKRRLRKLPWRWRHDSTTRAFARSNGVRDGTPSSLLLTDDVAEGRGVCRDPSILFVRRGVEEMLLTLSPPSDAPPSSRAATSKQKFTKGANRLLSW